MSSRGIIAFEFFMKERSNNHFDSGEDGIFSERRSCHFHCPYAADDIANCKTQPERLSQEAGKLQMQLDNDNAYNLVEQGVYTLELFRTRREKLTDALDEIHQRQAAIEETLHKLESSKVTQTNLIPQTEALLNNSYDHMTNQERNMLLKAILHRIEYAKGADGKIEIDLYPRLPKL